MSTHRENFGTWFVKVLESLYPCPEAGFVIVMAALPMLERYLRQRAGTPSGPLSRESKFYDELRDLFPGQIDKNQAFKFWQNCRNGLLHQVTFSQKLGEVWFSHDKAEISIDLDGRIWVNPVDFARRVTQQIENDFPTFEGASSAALPLPEVGQYEVAPNTIMQGTSAKRS